MSREDLIKNIRLAFNDVRLEDGISLMQAAAIDDYEYEVLDQVRKLDVEQYWWDVEDEKISSNPVLAHMDAKGFRFYIPAFMTYTLKNYDKTSEFIIDSTIYNLSPCKGDLWDHCMMHYSLINELQKKSIVLFLEYFSTDKMGQFVDSKYAQMGLENYWSQYA